MGDHFLDCLLLLYMEADLLQEHIVDEAKLNRVINRFKAMGACGKRRLLL